jgi:hypothetical protein
MLTYSMRHIPQSDSLAADAQQDLRLRWQRPPSNNHHRKTLNVPQLRNDLGLDHSHTIRVVVDEIKALLVVDSGKVSLRDSEPNAIAKTLPERPGGDLNTYGKSEGFRAIESIQMPSV